MKRRTFFALLAGGALAATAAMAIPVTQDPARDISAGTIQAGWSHTSRSDGEVSDTWWAVKGHCAADILGERLICDALGMLVRTGSQTFENKTSVNVGLPLPGGWVLMTANNSPFIRSAHVETPRDLQAVLGFYRAALVDRGWTENAGAAVETERAVIGFTTDHGPASLRLTRQDSKTIVDLSQRKWMAATAGFLPKPEHGRLMLGNKTDDAAIVTVNERTIKLAAHAGEKLAHSDSAAGELPDDQKLDLSPGKYKVTVMMDGSTVQSREFEVAANETWGLLVVTNGVLLPVRVY